MFTSVMASVYARQHHLSGKASLPLPWKIIGARVSFQKEERSPEKSASPRKHYYRRIEKGGRSQQLCAPSRQTGHCSWKLSAA